MRSRRRSRTCPRRTPSAIASCTAASAFATPCSSTTASWRPWASSPTSRPCTSPRPWPAWPPSAVPCPTCPRSPASTRRSTRRCRRRPRPTPCPASGASASALRRFGFHGLSHAYASRRAAAPRVVSCHLGAGASLAAVRDGVCVDTTMGFTPMEGLVMATRAGSVDPGLVLWLLRHGVDADALEQGLDRDGGIRGLAGDADMRAVLARDDDDARLAIDVYVHRLGAQIAAMAAALGGLDALVFTGGVGEHAPEVRARTAAGLAFLGVAARRRGQRARRGRRGDRCAGRAGAHARRHRARGPRGRPAGARAARRASVGSRTHSGRAPRWRPHAATR